MATEEPAVGALLVGVSYVHAVVEMALTEAGPIVPSIAILRAPVAASRQMPPIKLAIPQRWECGAEGA